MTVSEVEDRIVKQVEFYFGDSNLPRDKFLLEKTRENEDACLCIELIASFQRIKSLCSDVETVKKALKEGCSETIKVNEEKTMVRRKTPVPESINTLRISVFAKGFPPSATLDCIQEFFSGISGEVKAIRMRRDLKTREFKGSVFVEVGTEEEAARLALLENLTFGERPIVVMTKLRYFETKNEERTGGKKERLVEKDLSKDFVKGCIAVIVGVPSDVSHQTIKSTIGEEFQVSFAAIEDGNAWLRFKEPVASSFVEKFSQEGLVIGESTIKDIRIATEDEESEYYAKLAQVMANKQSGSNRGRGNSRRGGNNKRSTRNNFNAKKAKLAEQSVENNVDDYSAIEANNASHPEKSAEVNGDDSSMNEAISVIPEN